MKLFFESQSAATETNNNRGEIAEFLQHEFITTEAVYHDAHNAKARVFSNPSLLWPRTPMGHRWLSNANGEVSLLAHRSAVPVKTEVVLFGPNDHNQVNYITLFNGVNMQSFSYTRPAKNTYCYGAAGKAKQVNRYPSSLTTDQFKANDNNQYIRGHSIDYKDTIENGALSSNDPRNFLPEVSNEIYWNGIRNWWISDIRKRGSAYIQVPYYDENSNFHFYANAAPVITVSGAFVPKGVFLSEIGASHNMSVKTTYDISWSFPFDALVNNRATTYKKCAEKFITVVNDTLPKAMVSSQKEARKDFNVVASHAQVPLAIVKSRNARYQTDCLYYSAENEVSTSENKLRFAFHLSSVLKDEASAKSYLHRAKTHAEFISSLDTKDEVIETATLKKISIHNQQQDPGFEETEDLDFWNSIRKA